MRTHIRTNGLRIMTFALVLGISACTVHLIADYDPLLDSGATALSNKVNAFLAKMETASGTPSGTYAANVGFYSEAQGDLKTLELRAANAPQSEKILESVRLLSENIENLRKLHEGRGNQGLSRPILDPARSALEIQFRALFAVENALRRGK